MTAPRLARSFSACVVLVALASSAIAAEPLPRLKVSENHRFLVTERDEPFFYLADTAWELFHRLDRDEADHYLETRARQGFNVIQAVALAELDGLTAPNAYGHLPLVDMNPARPAVAEGDFDDYWDHVDHVVARANELKMYVGFLPTWGRYWREILPENGLKPLFTPQNAEAYGEFLGRRYRDAGIVWILGGDRPIADESHKEIMRAMARGLKKGDGGAHLTTFHPPGGAGSADWLHDEPWLDFHMRQNGHVCEFTNRYDKTGVDYARTPPKPVLDGEPIYEDHPINFNAAQFGHSTSADVRRPLYWDLFQGACGHAYGHHSVWQMYDGARPGKNNPLMTWREALGRPAAKQMAFAKRLLESRPYLTRVPDDSIVVAEAVKTAVPGAGRYRFVATRDEARTYALVYVPLGREFSVDLGAVAGDSLRAWWFDPRTGEAESIGEFKSEGKRRFAPPAVGESLDWVLVLDDAAKKYPPPGAVEK